LTVVLIDVQVEVLAIADRSRQQAAFLVLEDRYVRPWLKVSRSSWFVVVGCP
jgi:hypothetical protein